MNAVLAPTAQTDALDLTAPQYGMWAAQQLEPDSPSLWTAEAIELNGDLDVDALLQSVRETLAACDALHMRYHQVAGRVVQRLDGRRAVEIERHDFAGAGQGGLLAHAWMRRDLLQTPDLQRGPLFKTALLRVSRHKHLWYLRSHHIALDGFAYLLLIHRVARLYSVRCGADRPEPARDWSLRALVEEDQDYRASPKRAADRAFWQAKLAGAPTPVSLAPPQPPADTARSQRALLPPADYSRWQGGARACGVDWAVWLVAAIAAWMHRASGACDLSIGLLVMNRLGSAALSAPCMAMNVVPLRVRVDPQVNFHTLTAEVGSAMRELREHRRYNYEDLRMDMGLAGSHAQLYGPVVNLMPFDRAFVFAGLRSRAHPVSVGAVEDLDITVSPLEDGIRFDIEANPDAYPADTLRELHGNLLAIIEAVLADNDVTVAALPGAEPRPAAADAVGA